MSAKETTTYYSEIPIRLGLGGLRVVGVGDPRVGVGRYRGSFSFLRIRRASCVCSPTEQVFRSGCLFKLGGGSANTVPGKRRVCGSHYSGGRKGSGAVWAPSWSLPVGYTPPPMWSRPAMEHVATCPLSHPGRGDRFPQVPPNRPAGRRDRLAPRRGEQVSGGRGRGRDELHALLLGGGPGPRPRARGGQRPQVP